jgi:signal transduction histidine kinase
LIRLVNDILDLERMKSGKISIEPVEYNLQQLLIQAGETMQPMATKGRVELEVQPYDVMMQLDPDRILQTLTNLLSNAIKFTPPGGKVWLKAGVRGDRCLIVVKDTGRGIPADKLHFIFERFQQVDTSDSRSKGGTGLGLAICRHIVERHNGKIWVESVLGEGSVFYVYLPLDSNQ